MRPVDLAFLICDALGIILMLLPFAAHFRAMNTATCFMIFYTVLGSINRFINTAIWHNSIENYAPVWCDISSNIIVGLSLAIPLASLCINRRLAGLRKASAAPPAGARRKEAIIDTVICTIPVLIFLAVHYTQQGHRFDIAESFGCNASTYFTELGLTFVFLPPIIVSFISCCYSATSIHFFWKRHRDFESFLRNSSNGLSRSNYIRLMLLAGCEAFIGFPLTLIFLCFAIANGGVHHWKSWADTHWGFSRHNVYTRWELEQAGPVILSSFEIARWLFPFTCLIFFCFFGFGKDVYKSYYDSITWVARKGFNKSMPSYEEYLYSSSTRKSKPFSISLFGHTIVFYSPSAWKKANGGSTTNKSVSVALPQHHRDADLEAGARKGRRDSLGYTVMSADGDADEVMSQLEKEDLTSCDTSVRGDASVIDKELADYIAELPVLDAGLSAPPRAHARSPSHASDQLTIRMEVEHVQSHI